MCSCKRSKRLLEKNEVVKVTDDEDVKAGIVRWRVVMEQVTGRRSANNIEAEGRGRVFERSG